MGIKRIAIIGAGPCGLFQLLALKGMNVDVVCFERQSDWGGMWLFTPETGVDAYGQPVHSSMYRESVSTFHFRMSFDKQSFCSCSLWSNGPKELVESVKYTFDEHFGHPTPSYQPRSVVYDYLTGRAKLGDVRQYIRFQTAVQNVDYMNEEFQIAVKDLVTDTDEHLTFDYVIVATGRYTTPNVPHFDGMETFPGKCFHAKEFRDARDFVNQHVLIIGSGYAAEDIAVQLFKFGARKITISYRTQPLNYNWPDKITQVPLLVRMEGRTGYFRDGATSEGDIDTIILCTGYTCSFPFMADHLRLNCDMNDLYPSHLYKGVFWDNQPQLVYLGVQSLIFQFTMFDLQAELVRGVICGQYDLPDLLRRQEDITEWRLRANQIGHGVVQTQLDFQIEYMRDMLGQCSSFPQFDIDRVTSGIHELIRHKSEDIMTYRDQSFASIVTGRRALDTTNRVPWLQLMDDSLEGFLKPASAVEEPSESEEPVSGTNDRR